MISSGLPHCQMLTMNMETLKRVVKIKADDPEEAIEKVRKKYDDSEIILDADDFKTVFIKDCKRKPVIESQRVV